MHDVKTALVLTPHADDEISCAGAISRLIELGADVHCVAFSRCDESVPEGMRRDILEMEWNKAMDILGIRENRTLLKYPVRRFNYHRQSILEDMVKMRQGIAPDVVFAPATSDTYQDHSVVRRETIRAFKGVTILGYEHPLNDVLKGKYTYFVPLEDRHMQVKSLVEQCYKSQSFRWRLSGDFWRSLAVVRGAQAKSEYAEAFEAIRIIRRFS